MNELTEEWVDKAEEDFDASDALLYGRDVPITAVVCFHCQQCAEKYLKAYLQEHSLEFERNHELLPLMNLCAFLDPEFKVLKRDLESLKRFAVAVRYPGIHVTKKSAEGAFKSAKRVRKFIRRKLGIK
jgi:HEPN domain-containing protein